MIILRYETVTVILILCEHFSTVTGFRLILICEHFSIVIGFRLNSNIM